MSEVSILGLGPEISQRLSSIIRRANSDLSIFTNSEVGAFVYSPEVTEKIDAIFNALRASGKRLIGLEGADNSGKSALATRVAQHTGSKVVPSKAVSDQMLEQCGIPAGEKARFFLRNKGNAASEAFFLTANLEQLRISAADHEARTCLLDGFVFRTLAAHKVQQRLNAQVSGIRVEPILERFELSLVDRIVGEPLFAFVFLFDSPGVNELHLSLRRDATATDQNTGTLDAMNGQLLQSFRRVRKSLQACAIYSIRDGERANRMLSGANTAIFSEEIGSEIDLESKSRMIERWLEARRD